MIPASFRRAIEAVIAGVLGMSAKYDSGWFAVAANTDYTKTHGLNKQPVNVAVFFSEAAAGGAEHRVTGITSLPNYGAGTTEYLGSAIYNTTTTALTVRTADKPGLNASNTWVASGYYRVLVWV